MFFFLLQVLGFLDVIKSYVHRPNYPDWFCLLPLNPSVGIWVKLASLLPFFFFVRLYVLYLSFVNPFFSCFDGIYSFSTSTTTK